MAELCMERLPKKLEPPSHERDVSPIPAAKEYGNCGGRGICPPNCYRADRGRKKEFSAICRGK